MELKSMTLAIMQARLTSKRLPGKVLKVINGKPMIYWQLKRIQKAKTVKNCVVAISSSDSDNELAEYLESIDAMVVRGSLNDVKSRFDDVLQKYPASEFIRLTADCPLIMPDLIDDIVTEFKSLNLDYVSNTLEPTYPDGLDIEVVRSSSFLSLDPGKLSKIDKEHVTFAMYSTSDRFSIKNFKNDVDLSHMRWTVDYQEDLDFVREVYDYFQNSELEFNMSNVLSLLASESNLKNKIDGNRRNESLKKMLSDIGFKGNDD